MWLAFWALTGARRGIAGRRALR